MMLSYFLSAFNQAESDRAVPEMYAGHGDQGFKDELQVRHRRTDHPFPLICK